MYYVYKTLLTNHDFVLLIGSDSPQITPKLITDAAELIIETGEFVLGPAKDGGFYLIGGSREIMLQYFLDVAYDQN